MKKKNIYGIIVVALVCIGIILGGKDINISTCLTFQIYLKFKIK